MRMAVHYKNVSRSTRSTHTHTHIHTYIRSCAHTHIHICVHIHTYTYAYTHIHIHIYIHIYTYMYTFTRSDTACVQKTYSQNESGWERSGEPRSSEQARLQIPLIPGMQQVLQLAQIWMIKLQQGSPRTVVHEHESESEFTAD